MDFDSSDPFGFDDFDSGESLDALDIGNDYTEDGEYDNKSDSYGRNYGDDFSNVFEENISDIGGGSVDIHNNSGDRNKVIRTSIIVVLAGLVVILLAVTLNRIKTGGHKENKVYQENSSSVVEDRPVEYESVTSDNWIQFNLDNLIEFDSTIESSFTITGIKHYALVNNSSNDKQLKSVVVGSINGLHGTYEMEIPFDMAQNLSVGAEFIISYKITEINNYNVVSGLKY